MYEVYIHIESKADKKQCNINFSFAEESYKHPTYVRGGHAGRWEKLIGIWTS